ncbi:xylulokinase [Chloroflexota bacterium]
MKNHVLAHDLGTTGNKATIYNSNGDLVCSSLQEYDTSYIHSGWAEQNPDDWWRAVCDSTKELLFNSGLKANEIAVVTFSGQMMGCIPLGKDARALRPAIIWADQRAVDQERLVSNEISRKDIYHITGHRLNACYSLCKILWLRDHEPDVYRDTYKFVHAKDAMVARITGNFVTDYSDASGMNLYDLENGTWSQTIIDGIKLDSDKLPELHQSTDVVGEVLPNAAADMGLNAGTPVVIGGGDGVCAAVGAGVIQEGSTFNYIGSSSWIAVATKKPIYDPDYRTFTWAHLLPGMFTPNGTMQMAGGSYQWVRDQLCPMEKREAEKLGVNPYQIMDSMASNSPVGSKGLLFLPYLMGERSPRWNHKARGVFVGLTIRHKREDIIRSVLEGITLNLRIILDALTAQGAQIKEIRVIGGGARAKLWNRIMADIYNRPIHRLSILEEATSMGAALAGGIGVGIYPGFSKINEMNTIISTCEPNREAHEIYEKTYPIFKQAYDSMIPIYEMISETSLWNS